VDECDKLDPVFENTYFSFFSDPDPKKRKKSVAKILFSMMLTLLQKKKKFVECL